MLMLDEREAPLPGLAKATEGTQGCSPRGSRAEERGVVENHWPEAGFVVDWQQGSTP
jgi:hypothetical protein